ncbi:uncharacterized protein LOC116615559 [Nematostella vectensis]|uniref:uncharacterized protein LOC116615559 n=1 Tax=Nematostella vectensis TaxID=45351 RepID=UPI00138FC151|nr:uncharacterized protein LOC116615559 [Nematostella vectensis]
MSRRALFLLYSLIAVGDEVLCRPHYGAPIAHPKQFAGVSNNPAYTATKKQAIIAVPPVTTSNLRGPYLPPADADNQIFLPHHGFHGYHTGLHFRHGYYVPRHEGLYRHLYPNHLTGRYHWLHGSLPYRRLHPFGYHDITRIPIGYHNHVPLGMLNHYNLYDAHWPHMDVSGPVAVSDPNDGLYQVPGTGALIPRPIMPQQYPVLLDHSSNMAGENGPGVVFLGGTMKSAIPVDPSSVENQILENSANLHDSPKHEVQQRLELSST